MALIRSSLASLAVTLAACGQTVGSPQEVATAVLAREAWVSDAKACPADLMPANARIHWDDSIDCEGKAVGNCYAECRRHDAEACYWLAQRMLTEKLDDASDVLFQRACFLGEASGCTNRAASMMHANSSDSSVLACTTRSFLRTCEAEDPWGCTMYGSALHRGDGVARDDVAAIGYLDRACGLIQTATHESCEKGRRLKEKILAEAGPARPVSP